MYMEAPQPTITKKNDWEEVILENESLLVKVLPELGGKIVELVNKNSGTQFLKESNSKFRKITEPSAGFTFDERYAFGFDECFPTVGACHYPFNERMVQWPDHGEIWSQKCEIEQLENSIILTADGVNVLYEFKKEISLIGNELKIDYRLQNKTYRKFDYLWSAHPLLEIDEGDEILLPGEETMISIYGSNQESLNKLGGVSWPKLDQKNDFSKTLPRSKKLAIKLFAEHLKKGKAALYRKKRDESISFHFDLSTIPYLGIWMCYGGWPKESSEGDYTLGLEPTTATCDKLSEAIQKGQNMEIKPGETKAWGISLVISNGKAEV